MSQWPCTGLQRSTRNRQPKLPFNKQPVNFKTALHYQSRPWDDTFPTVGKGKPQERKCHSGHVLAYNDLLEIDNQNYHLILRLPYIMGQGFGTSNLKQ